MQPATIQSWLQCIAWFNRGRLFPRVCVGLRTWKHTSRREHDRRSLRIRYAHIEILLKDQQDPYFIRMHERAIVKQHHYYSTDTLIHRPLLREVVTRWLVRAYLNVRRCVPLQNPQSLGRKSIRRFHTFLCKLERCAEFWHTHLLPNLPTKNFSRSNSPSNQWRRNPQWSQRGQYCFHNPQR